MIINKQDALFVLAVAASIGEIPPHRLTDRCPECGQLLGHLDNDNHLVIDVSDRPGVRRDVAVIIGCEGYWVIDPALVGVAAPNWQGPRDDDHQECVKCGDRVYTLSSRGWCDGCEEEAAP